MRWILFAALLWSQGPGEGNLQRRLSHRIDHGWIVTALEIDRDVVLPSEKQLLTVFTIKPSGPEPVFLAFEGAEAVVFSVACADKDGAWSGLWRQSMKARSRMVHRSGWPIRLNIPVRSGQREGPLSGRCILQARLLLNPPLENRIAFQVR